MIELAAGLINEVGGLPSIVYGAIAFVLFVACALFVWTFRDVANRHSAKAAAYAKAHPEHATPVNYLDESKTSH